MTTEVNRASNTDLATSPRLSTNDPIDDLQFDTNAFSEDDVLPFLLQAQDMIAKLEAKVIDLETDLSTIHRKYEHDRHDWLVGLSQKDQYIHHLTNKIHRLEFNTKETIVLLSDITSDPSHQLNETVMANITLGLNYLRQSQNPPPPSSDSPEFEDAGEDLEEGELERRQAAANEWRKKQESASGYLGTQWPVDVMHDLDRSNGAGASVVSPRPTDTDGSLVNEASANPASATSADSARQRPSSEEEEIARPGQSRVSVPLPTIENPFCANCRQLLTQLDQQIEQKAYLKRDLSALASALAQEEQMRSSIEQIKDALEEDVQHITNSLFSILNCILMDEMTDRDGLVRLDRELSQKLTPVLQAWDTREERLKELKELFVELDSAVNQSMNATERLGQYRFDESEAGSVMTRLGIGRHASLRFSSPPSPLVPQSEDDSIQGLTNRTVRIDGLVFSEFQQHIKALTTSPQVALPNTAYMKRVMVEDIEPCLFQDAGSTWWKSPWFKRKLLDAIANNRCDIQSWNSGLSSSASSSPATSHISASSAPGTPTTTQPPPMPPKTKCTCCGNLRVCEFRMRLHSPPNQRTQKIGPWLPIDRFCRDRIVAVCDFYTFASHLRQGLMQNSSPLQMFKQSLHYRRRMGLAKVGSIGLFEDFRPQYRDKRRSRSKRESIVLDHSGSGSDTGSIVSVSDVQGLQDGGQIIIVH